ncbi:hypothetical protein ABIG04_004208 [Bradyrhizobium japonicum]
MSEHEREHPSVVGQNGVVGLVIDAALGAVSLMMLLPLVFLISNAFKTPPELLAWPPTVIPHQPTLDNIVSVLRETPLFRWIGNSLIFATLSTASIVSTSAIAGYVLGKFDLPGIPVIFGGDHRDGGRSLRSLHDPALSQRPVRRTVEHLARAPGRLSHHEFRHLPGAAICDDVDP